MLAELSCSSWVAAQPLNICIFICKLSIAAAACSSPCKPSSHPWFTPTMNKKSTSWICSQKPPTLVYFLFCQNYNVKTSLFHWNKFCLVNYSTWRELWIKVTPATRRKRSKVTNSSIACTQSNIKHRLCGCLTSSLLSKHFSPARLRLIALVLTSSYHWQVLWIKDQLRRLYLRKFL